MEADEISEKITGHHHHVTDETFRKRIGVFIGVLAMLLAIVGLGANSATKTTINQNILASDAYAFYQARNIRQTAVNLTADELELGLATRPDTPEAARQAITQKIDALRKQVQRWESDPQAGDGKKELLVKAKGYEAARDKAQERAENFEFAEALLQIAVVLASTSILTASRPLLALSALFGLGGILLGLNGFLGFVPWPHGH